MGSFYLTFMFYIWLCRLGKQQVYSYKKEAQRGRRIQLQKQSFRFVSLLQTVQILIGLIHIGLGFIMLTVLYGYYVAISFYGGFPFWGGVLVSKESHQASELPEVSADSGHLVKLSSFWPPEISPPRQHMCESSSGLVHQAYLSAWAAMTNITDWVA